LDRKTSTLSKVLSNLVSQAGFWQHRSCTEQIMALTSHIEAANSKKVRCLSISLLRTTLFRVLNCRKYWTIFYRIVSFKFFLVSRITDGEDLIMDFLREVSLHRYCSTYTWRTFHLHCWDNFNMQIALAFQADSFFEANLEANLERLNRYQPRLKHVFFIPVCTMPTVCWMFNLLTHWSSHLSWSHLGLDLQYPFDEVGEKGCCSRQLTGTNWRASAETLRTVSLVIVYSTAEYCAPMWLNNVHFSKIYVQLNNTMRQISGTTKSTQFQWLLVL
jgi:hypothetical protein